MDSSNIVSASQKRNKDTHKLGRITTALSLMGIFMIPIITQIFYNLSVDTHALFMTVTALSAFLIAGFTEFFSYAPILGPGGTYLAFITGNISNLKLPAAISGQGIAGVTAGTEEGNIVSTLAIGISSIVTTIVIFAGMLFLSQLMPILNNPVLKPAFDNMIYALMGAFSVPTLLKSPKQSSIPVLIMALVVFNIIPVSSILETPFLLCVAVAWSYFLFKRKNTESNQK